MEPKTNEESSAGRPLTRKEALLLLGGAGAAVGATWLSGCGGSGADASSNATPTPAPTSGSTPTPVPSASPTPTPGASATPTPTPAPTPTPSPTPVPVSCTLIPTETDGPYPLYSVLRNAGMRRSDVREGKAGVPLTLTLTLVDVNDVCGPIADAYVYIWHCDKDGQYSGYSSSQNGSHLGETFCRGIQQTDSHGQVTFQTIYPGWYAGRITHVHFQVYLATLSGSATATSQIAFPQDITRAVYNSSLYAARGQNTSVTSFAQDNVFRDGTTYQMATVTGDTTSGYAAALTIGVRA